MTIRIKISLEYEKNNIKLSQSSQNNHYDRTVKKKT